MRVAFFLPRTGRAPKLYWPLGLESAFRADHASRSGPASATGGLSAKRRPDASGPHRRRAPRGVNPLADRNRRCGHRSLQWSQSRPRMPPARSLRRRTESPAKPSALAPGAAPEGERVPGPAAERGSAQQAQEAAPAETGAGRDTRSDRRSAGCRSGRTGHRARPLRSGRSSQLLTPRRRSRRAERSSNRDGSA